MPLVLFSFALDTETQEATFSGTMEAQAALQVLQQIVIAEAIKQATGQKGEDSVIMEPKESPNGK